MEINRKAAIMLLARLVREVIHASRIAEKSIVVMNRVTSGEEEVEKGCAVG